MVDARVSGARAARRAGSIPVLGTNVKAGNSGCQPYFVLLLSAKDGLRAWSGSRSL